ncbi:MAG TPA: type II toxin-antitoxin system HicA family toxin [Chthoniobacterales bacterium]|nr:type II toxin-antitoxin system HicA family toxin [Chthoniobacterales bacterium]
MPKHPRLTGAELVDLLITKGFTIVRVKGSHHRLYHPDGRVTTVPLHRREIIGPGLLKQIMRDTKLDLNDL